MKVVITTTSFGKYDRMPLDELEREKLEYILNPYGRKLTREEVIVLAEGAHGIIAGTEPLDAAVLEQLQHLRVISRCGAGMDNVDIKAAEASGIQVFNTPDGPTLAVAELTVGLILDLLRKVSLMDRKLREGVWEKNMGNLLYGKRIAIIGFGRIGQRVAYLLTPFGVDIAYCDVCSIECSFPEKEKRDLLSWGDIITLHCSPSPDDGSIIGKEELKQMQKGAWLINGSRGGLVDEEALYWALKDGYLSGAALDVFANEPYTGPLCELDNVILTPHIGSYAIESRIEMELQAVRNVIKGLKKQ
jgi:D-3-phosphoglycerate dehydrogenase